ncbi:MAG: hypothetical protein E7514_08130 [Ruminococcaceae bacterium]|nr:hypothetical protein [Oscillospiraceae bacterium]
MTGLEKILSQIEQESNDRCQEIIRDAQKKAEGIIADAEMKADAIIAESEAQTLKKTENLNASAVSSAELTESRILLKAKLDAIDDILARALEVIKALPKKEYFEILKELIIKNADKGTGELRLSAQDTEKLPSNFLDSVNNALKKGCSVKLGKSADIDSGFILSYGDVDINCSFDAIAASKRDELRDALNSLLFN